MLLNAIGSLRQRTFWRCDPQPSSPRFACRRPPLPLDLHFALRPRGYILHPRCRGLPVRDLKRFSFISMLLLWLGHRVLIRREQVPTPLLGLRDPGTIAFFSGSMTARYTSVIASYLAALCGFSPFFFLPRFLSHDCFPCCPTLDLLDV